MTIDVPPGALPADTVITITRAPDAPAPTGATVLGTSYVLGPEGTQFSKPVTVRLGFDPSKLPQGISPASVVVITAPSGSDHYAPLAGGTVTGNQVSAPTSHFSIFAPAVVECGAACTGSSAPSGSTAAQCECHLTCLGTAYSMSCSDGTCTCGGGAKASNDCLDSGKTIQIFRDACGFPGEVQGGSSSGDGGSSQTDASPCARSCSGSTSGCGCNENCNGHAYALTCTGTTCTCTTDGQKTSDVTGSGSCTAADWALCGY
jgi:hypothetical protein